MVGIITVWMLGGRDYYGVDVGWLAHGFVDMWLDGSAHGDMQWSLCPTCGAWAALVLYERYLYSPQTPEDEADALEFALPVLRGAILFFQEYLVPATGYTRERLAMEECARASKSGGKLELQLNTTPPLLTGPATSPENSYFERLRDDGHALFPNVVDERKEREEEDDDAEDALKGDKWLEKCKEGGDWLNGYSCSKKVMIG